MISACKKANERTCFKSHGAAAQIEIPLDSVNHFNLYKNIRYHIYQDTLRKVIIKGGENVIPFIDIAQNGYEVSIQNKNKCNFLRDFDTKILVEIHYPWYDYIYSETNDSLLFKDTVLGDRLYVEQTLGGGGVKLNVNVNKLILVVSHGVGNYSVSGQANFADLRVQTNGSGDARQLQCPDYLLDNNSTADLRVNLNQATAKATIRGTGNILYSGVPDSLETFIKGDGQVIGE